MVKVEQLASPGSWISQQHSQSGLVLWWRSDFCLPETDSPFAGARGSRTVTFKHTPPPASLTRPNQGYTHSITPNIIAAHRSPVSPSSTCIVAFFAGLKFHSTPGVDSGHLWYHLSRQRPCWSYGEPSCCFLGAGVHFTVLPSTPGRVASTAAPNAAERIDLDAPNQSATVCLSSRIAICHRRRLAPLSISRMLLASRISST